MYSRSGIALKYLRYYLTSLNGRGHGIHSPFIFHFVTDILNDKRHYPEYDQVESLREQLLHDKRVLTIEDFGAGSSVNKTNRRAISAIAKNAAKPAKFGQLFFRMARAYQPGTVLELGTSLGISSAYMALARPAAKVITLEGAGAIAAVARENFNTLQIPNIDIREGNFDDILSPVLKELAAVNLAFIDGNHRRASTLQYFAELLLKTNNDSILIVDDIRWSREMEQAWSAIRAHPAVRCSVDLFFIGIVFFRQEFREKQHFTIRF